MREYQPVNSKRDFVKRYEAGEFGNRTPTWKSVDDWLDEFPNPYMTPVNALYHLRNRIAGDQRMFYNVHPLHLLDFYHKLLDMGVSGEALYVSQMIPQWLEKNLLIQGEVHQDYLGRDSLVMFYSTVPKPMRDSLREGGRSAYGVCASTILKTLMCPNSWDWLNILLERYPGHMVEFSTYPRCWGTLPNFNTIFWEVRAY